MSPELQVVHSREPARMQLLMEACCHFTCSHSSLMPTTHKPKLMMKYHYGASCLIHGKKSEAYIPVFATFLACD
jgi:hypothetical protein